MRRIPVLLCLAASMWSCSAEKGSGGGDMAAETLEPDFFVGTRADLNGDPQHGDAYTLVSYNVGGTSSTEAYKNQIADARNVGYYAYDDGVLSGRPAGTFVPVAIKVPGASDIPPFSYPPFYAPSGGISPLAIDRSKGQTLAAAPVTGLNPTTNLGKYRTAVIYPAIPFHDTSIANLGYLGVYHINTDIWASRPDDADGDPGTDDPFEILVNTNRMIYDLPAPTILNPVKSAIKVSFYSEYYSETDPGVPRSQTFGIASLKLVNVGSNGWFNARTGIVYPNYNYGATPTTGVNPGHQWRTIYSATEIGVNPDGTPLFNFGAYNFIDLIDPDHNGNTDDSLVVDESGNNILPPKRPNSPEPTQYIQWSAETPVFPSDYRGAENGGLTEVKPLILRMELSVGASGASLKATVPIALLMEHGKRYNFYVNVMSTTIVINYKVSEWGSGGGDGDIGGDMMEYEDFEIEFDPDGWVVVDNDSGDIGGEDTGN